MHRVAISGLGLHRPKHTITNEDLVESFNSYIQANPPADVPLEKALSSTEFIEKASGIKQRYVIEKDGILDINRMRPNLPKRAADALSIQCEFSLPASLEAIVHASKSAADIDLIIMACSNHERAYPAVAIELQKALGAKGAAYDMNVACSSATFGLELAKQAVAAGTARCVLVVNPEITSAHLNWRNRDCHFIFGDVCTAAIVERLEDALEPIYEIKSTQTVTAHSTAITNQFGFLANVIEPPLEFEERFFNQEGRRVFKEVVPMVCDHISRHLSREKLGAQDVAKYWLHQANANMNTLIGKKLLGEPTPEQVPMVLDRYANTSSAGVMIALAEFGELKPKQSGILCSFGAGYSIGSVLLEKL